MKKARRPTQGARVASDPGPSADQVGLASRAFAERLINDLLRLRKSVRESQRGELRDAKAHEALKLASMLFEQLAGWARDHVAGRALKRVPAAPYAKGTTAERALGSRRPWDDSTLEELGTDYDFDDPAANQRIIVALMYELGDVLGYRLAFQLSDAFEGLQFGEVADLVTPTASYRKGKPYELWQLRLKAVEHVEFLRGTGLKKYEAQDVVAKAYGLGDAISLAGRKTLEQWQRRLPGLMEPFTVRDTLFVARNHGARLEQLKKEEQLDHFHEEHLQSLIARYGPRALNQNGKKFKNSQSN